MLKDLIAVAIGGGLGASGRYLAGMLARSLFQGEFPWGTLVVNVAGCFLIGLVVGKIGSSETTLRLFLVVGILGGFTTFSAFGYETLRLLQEGSPGAAFFNIAAQLLLGLAGVWAGASLAKGLWPLSG